MFNLSHKMIKLIKHLWEQQHSFVGLRLWQDWKLISPLFHLPFTSLKEKISLRKFLYLNYEDPRPPALLLHLRLQSDSKQKGCHADLKEQ